jgi:hypothetical protein
MKLLENIIANDSPQIQALRKLLKMGENMYKTEKSHLQREGRWFEPVTAHQAAANRGRRRFGRA